MTTRRILLILIVLSVLGRVASAVYQGNQIEPLPGVADQVSYHQLAQRVLDGHGFSFATGWWPATRANQPTAHWSFLYVLFLSAVYAVFGPEPMAARLVQALLAGVLQPWLAWRIGRRVFDDRVGLTSAGITALYGYFVFYGGALVTEPLFAVAFLWALDRATALAYRPGRGAWSRWAMLGLALGCAALLRQAFILVIPVILVWLAWELGLRGRGPARIRLAPPQVAGRLALTVAVMLACILPWTARNYRAFGEFVLLNTNAGFVFFWANHPVHGSRFIPILPSGPTNYGNMIPAKFESLNEARLDRALLAEGIGFVRADPVRYVKLSISRIPEFFKFWPSADSGFGSNLVRVLSFGIMAPFLLAGAVLVLTRHRQVVPSGAGLLLAVAAVYSLAHVLTWTLVRYRLPVDAIAVPIAAYAAVLVFERVAGRAAVAGAAASVAN